MALIRSLTSGTSSLRAHQQRLDVISNNIANVNTVGFKSSRTTFSDQFNQTFTLGSSPNAITGGGIGGINPVQIGLGVKVGAITQDFSQGAIQTTNRSTDLALQGEGFFVVKRNGRELFTRAGTFSFDRDGFLVDGATGAYVQGYNLQTDANGLVVKDANGSNTLNRAVTNIQVSPTFKSAPRQTQNVDIAGNVNAAAAVGDVINSSITIIDNQGGEHVLRMEFTKTGADQFDLSLFIDGDTANPIGATTAVQFNPDGTLNTPTSFTVNAADINTALAAMGSSQTFDAGTPKNLTIRLADPNDLLGGLTQFAAQDTVSAIGQDGYASGDLERVSVDQTGKIIGAFTNGQAELLGQVVIAKFTNPGGLLKQGNNFFSVSPNSGLPVVGTAVEIFPSTSIAGGTVEESNVDLTEQFTDLISTQRAFEAASRTVTISDQFLQEINQLKR
jgi:flagellar hook protein FlgE